MSAEVIHAPLTATVLQLARLMATHRVSCIVITQLDAEDIEQPVGIVTERDIVQFQALQIDFAQTEAQMVMSSPLFLLSPKDSLWTAHQEMQKRRVGRLVVSWNWGQGLGIVTQTSLLRVFDPMEMYGVIENLQQTIQQLEIKQSEPKAPDQLPQTIAQSSDTASQLINIEPSSPVQAATMMGDHNNLLASLRQVHTTVQSVIDSADLPIPQQQSQLQGVLNQLAQLMHAVDSSS